MTMATRLQPGTSRSNPVRSKKPVGLPTRGKTAGNRLRRTDVFLALCHAGLIRRLSGLYVDLGYGENPGTTIETMRRLRRLNPSLRLLGVEIDPERVAAALPFSDCGLDFRLGGFNLPLATGEQAAFIRAMNVLRQYPEEAHAPAIAQMCSYLEEEGILVEGTSDPSGRLMVFNLFQRRGAGYEQQGLVFSVNFRGAFSPRDFQAVLPKNHIHHVEEGSPMQEFFQRWEQAWQRSRPQAASDSRRRFLLSARLLADPYGYDVELRPALLRRGYLRLRRLPQAEPAVEESQTRR
jgi:hypothetical protein